MRFVNSPNGKKKPFTPLDPNHVKLYVCGPTVYDRIHLGNARPLVVFDVLYRLLKYTFPRVTYVRNITDIDDKIIARAAKTNITEAALAESVTAQFHEDTAALLCLVPDHEPRATAHIAEMIALIETLLAKHHAYQVEGHVLFSMPALPEAAQLIPLKREALIDGARVDPAPYKRDPSDFVLWKPSDSKTIGWDSPFGFGRPGWHIECSAMAAHYLGDDFDIHGGGCDLLFPHHYNECAQSLCAAPESGFARYWLHNGYVLSEGEKMSKSLGNFYTVRELLEKYDGEILRLALLMTHYRKPLDFSHQQLQQAKNILDKFYGALRAHTPADDSDVSPAPQILEALADDLNTPLALTHLHELCGEIAQSRTDTKILCRTLKASAGLLGLLPRTPQEWFATTKPFGAITIDDTDIEKWIALRDKARQNKDYQTADDIRNQLEQQGVRLEDSGAETTWKRL